MNYDLAFRYARALQPDALVTIRSASDALAEAMRDAPNAGYDVERDPAVILLGRHLGRIASGLDPAATYAGDAADREKCFAKIAELRVKPALVPLARRGVSYEPEVKRGRRLQRWRANSGLWLATSTCASMQAGSRFRAKSRCTATLCTSRSAAG
jgi:hypothetical protein